MGLHNDYELNIEGGQKDLNGYVVMQHGQHYKVSMRNKTNKRCQASLTIDGKHIADYIINSYQTISIERPVDSIKKFTFYRTDVSYPTPAQTGIIAGKYQNGVIEVTFIPEKQFKTSPIVSYCRDDMFMNTSLGARTHSFNSNSFLPSRQLSFNSVCEDNYSDREYTEGGTGLSGHSNQLFHTASRLDLDNFKQVTLSLRLVADNQTKTFVVDHGCIYVPPIDKEQYILRQSPPPPARFATSLPRLHVHDDISPLSGGYRGISQYDIESNIWKN